MANQAPSAEDTLPPHDYPSELALLGCVLLAATRDDPALLSGIFSAADPTIFYHTGHEEIYRAMQTIHERGEVPDLTTVLGELGDKAVDLGGKPYLTAMEDAPSTHKRWPQYLRILKQKGQDRKRIESAITLQRKDATPEQIARAHEQLEDALTPTAALQPAATWTQIGEDTQMTTWCWPQVIANGHLTVLGGDWGAGKSWIGLALASCITNCGTWPDGKAGPTEPGRVFWLESEGRSVLMLERAKGMGVDTDRLFSMPDRLKTYHLDNPEDFDAVAAQVRSVQPNLVVVDSWSKAFGGKENDAEVRLTLDKLQTLAEEVGCPIILIHHIRKRSALDLVDVFDFDRLRGSSALAGAACTLLGVDRPVPQDPNLRRLSFGKITMGKILPEPVGFRIENDQVAFGDSPEIVEKPSQYETASVFLRTVLGSGPLLSRDVWEKMKELGLDEKTVKRAKAGLKIRSFKEGKEWWMELPETKKS